jgi:hypothetical protein
MTLFFVYLPFSLLPSLPEIMLIFHKSLTQSILQIFYLRFAAHKVVCVKSCASHYMWGIVLVFWCMKKCLRWFIEFGLNKDYSKNPCYNFTWIFLFGPWIAYIWDFGIRAVEEWSLKSFNRTVKVWRIWRKSSRCARKSLISSQT